MRASNSMRDQSNVTLQGIIQVPVVVKNIPSGSDGQQINPSGSWASTGNATGVSLWQLVMNSQFYNNYKGMYDQMKLNGFRCKILGNSASTLTMASGLSSVNVVTAFDRNGVGGVPITMESQIPTDRALTSPYIFMNSDPSEQLKTVNQVLTYGSAKSKPWSPGNSFIQYMSGYSQTAQEVQEWIPTDKLRITSLKFDESDAIFHWYLGFPNGIANPGVFTTVNYDPEVITGQAQFEISNSSIAMATVNWDPVLLIGVYNVPIIPSAATSAEQTFTFTVEYKVDVSFRGTRAGSVVNPSASKAMGSEVLQTLSATVQPNQTLTLEPAEGTLWNEAKLTGATINTTTLDLGEVPAGQEIDITAPADVYWTHVTGQASGDGVTVLPGTDYVGVDQDGQLLPATTQVWPTAVPNNFIIAATDTDRMVELPTITGDVFPRNIRLKVNAATYVLGELVRRLVARDEPYTFDASTYIKSVKLILATLVAPT